MVQLGYDSDDEGFNFEPAKQKFSLRKPITPYVCSTPCDFEKERKFIADEIFPELIELCLVRGTSFAPYDIRWSPGSLQTESGHLLRINLDFILKCSPYFLCLLGETYGPHRSPDGDKLPESLHSMGEDTHWLDKNYMIAASAGYNWILKEVHQNCSIPELEIIQAAFLSDNHYCHFYFRQPEHLDDLTAGLSAEESQELFALHKPKNEYADLNIRDLKQRIVNKGLPVKYFRTCSQLGAHVLSDWRAVIDELYPPLIEGPSLYDTEEYREWLCHEVFSDSRRHMYLNHSQLRTKKEELTAFCASVLNEPGCEYDDDLHQRFVGHSYASTIRRNTEVTMKTKSILVVKSDRGMGKSALISNWVKPFMGEHPEVKVISHYVGSSGRSRDVTTFLRRCIAELREEYSADDLDGLPNREAVSVDFKQLCSSFGAALALGPCVLVLDGVDELGASLGLSPQQVKNFSWLPLPLPQQCRVVITTLHSDLSCANLAKRPDTKIISLSNLNTSKLKAEFLEDHMQMHFSHLNRTRLQTIYEAKLSGRPLFLRILGSEMSAFSVYTDLDVYTEVIREMCTSIRDMFVRSFKRWSQDHSWTYEVLSAEQMESEEVDFIGWVPDVLRLLAVSRSGLTANEILEILVAIGYQENVQVTQFDWLMFLRCLGDNVTESPYGMLNFSHQHMREIVEYVLLRTVKPSTAEIISLSAVEKDWKKQKTEFHQHVIDHFRNQPANQRRVEELPWQLLMAGDMMGLIEVLTDPDMFLRLYDSCGKHPSNHYDLRMYWHYLTREGHNADDTYRRLLVQLGVLEGRPMSEQMEVQSLDGVSSTSSEDLLSDLRGSDSRGANLATPLVSFSPLSIPTIYTTPASGTPHKLSVIDEASDIMSRDDRSVADDVGNGADSVFLTQETTSPAEEQHDVIKYDLSPAQITSLTWTIAQFLLELGYSKTGETILMELNSRLMKIDESNPKVYPLNEPDRLIHAKVQEKLGNLFIEQRDFEMAEKWYKKALRSVMDMFEMEELCEYGDEIRALKCQTLLQIGYLRLQEGLLEDADDLLQEALDLSEVTRNVPTRALVLFHTGNLRLKQFDYLMSETNLRKCLMLRQQWYGKSHPLVADALFSLGKLMSDENNDKGYDRSSAGTAFRRCLEIRENHLDKKELPIAHVLFELGKLLKSETSYSGRMECQSLLARALDIHITQLGGDHIETRAVRSYLNNLETALKTGKHDIRSSERPYSSLTWRSQDLANIERKSNALSGKCSSYSQISRPASQLSKTGSHVSRPYSQATSRPLSGNMDYAGSAMSQRSGVMSYLPASERLMLETSKPRLLHRESVNRKLKQKQEMTSGLSYQHSPRDSTDDHSRRQINVDVDTGNNIQPQSNGTGIILDSFGNENERTAVKFQQPVSPSSSPRFDESAQIGRETPPQRLFRRYGSPQNFINGDALSKSGEVTLRTDASLTSRKDSAHRNKRPIGSARSIGSSHYTSASGMSVASHRSTCDIPRGPHSLHVSNSRTITQGPHSSVRSLLGDRGPKDTSKGIHHKSAWYHVPGRYSTTEKQIAPKRSQKRNQAKQIEQNIAPTAPDPHTSFMNSTYRKNNPRMIHKGYPGKDGHTCSKGQTYTPYPRHDKKQYILCDQCQHEAAELMAAREQELLGLVEADLENGVNLTPTVSGLTAPDRPRQMGYVLEEPIIPDDYGHHSTVTFKDAVVIN